MVKFSVGDKVFAKVRGYPPWPARVEAVADATPNKFKYHVFFFGTLETAVCKSEDLYSYAENKDTLGKPLKRKFFNEGLSQIEGTAHVPSLPRVKLYKNPCKNVEAERNAEESLIVHETPSAKPVKRKREGGSPGDHSRKQIVASGKRGSLPPQKRIKKDSTSSNGEFKINDNSVLVKQEFVSRSGRIIKPKRFADEAINPSLVTTGQGPSTHTDVANTSKDVDKKDLLLKRVKERRSKQVEFWKEECNMLKLIEQVKTEFNIYKANPEQGLILLDELCHLAIEPLMLKKHPDVVDTIEKLLRYTGNPVQWKYSKKQKLILTNICEAVRNKAKRLIDGFSAIFNVPNGNLFHEFFYYSVAEFENKTKDWLPDKVKGLIEDPTEKYSETVETTNRNDVKTELESNKSQCSNDSENDLQEEE